MRLSNRASILVLLIFGVCPPRAWPSPLPLDLYQQACGGNILLKQNQTESIDFNGGYLFGLVDWPARLRSSPAPLAAAPENASNVSDPIYNFTAGLEPLNASCACENMTLSAQFSSKSSIPSIESAFTARYVNLSAAGAYTDSAQTGTRNGSDSNGTSIAEPQLREAVCLPRAAAEALCEQRNQTSYFCPRKQGTIVVIVEEQIVVINNITKVVTTDGDKTTDFILQKEIDAFLKSFASPKKFFYGSNLGIGNFANLVLWVAFLFFCVVAIILQWMSARRPKHKIALLMLTLDNVIAMLGYLTMAFGHGRMYDDTAIFRAQKNETSGATFFTGSLVQVPTVPPFFYALYISWLLSTPPVLFVLCDLAGARSFLLSCLVLDVCMLLAGLGCAYMGKYEVARAVPARVAELRQASKWILFVVACACFAGLARQLAGPVKRKALKTGTLQVYSPLVWFTLAVWVCYPVVFLLTEAGLGLVGTDEEVVLFTLLDMVAKTGFTAQYLYLRRQAAPPHAEAWPLSPVPIPGASLSPRAAKAVERRLRGGSERRGAAQLSSGASPPRSEGGGVGVPRAESAARLQGRSAGGDIEADGAPESAAKVRETPGRSGSFSLRLQSLSVPGRRARMALRHLHGTPGRDERLGDAV